MVTGYVIMRVAAHLPVAAGRAPRPERAPAAHTYAIAVGIAQVGWIAFVFLDLPVTTTFACFTVLFAIELARPVPGRAQGADALARAPHRRALRPADDHHARRGHHRHDRRAQRARPRRGGLDDRRRAARRSPASACASAAGGRTSRSRGGGDRTPPAPGVHLRLRPPGDLRLARRDGRGPARRRLLPRGRSQDRRHRHRPQRRHPRRDLPAGAVRALLAGVPRDTTPSTCSCSRAPRRCWRW